MERVLIATWGNPFQWGEITYRLEEVELKSVSTLPVLIKALKPDKVIILVLDTLTNLTLNNTVPEAELGSYDEVTGDVEKRVKWFIDERIRPIDAEISDALEKAKIVVLPGIGEFENASVEGDVMDFYSAVLRVLAEELPTEDAEVFLDLTHGINFMPVLTYRALQRLLSILAYVRTVKLNVINSEPYPQGGREWKEKALEREKLNVLYVERSELGPRPLYSIIEDREEWSAFISSVTNGFPLAFITFYPNIAEVKKYVAESYGDFLGEIKVEMKPDIAGKKKVHITREKSLDENFRTAVKLYYMLRVFNGVFKGYPKKEATLNELFEVTRRLFLKMPRIGIVVEDQLCSFKNRKIHRELEKKLEKWVPLSGLIDSHSFSYSSSENHNPNIKLRNFIAHSGFEYNLVRVRLQNESKDGRLVKVLVFKYSRKNAVIKYLVDALKYRGVKGVNC